MRAFLAWYFFPGTCKGEALCVSWILEASVGLFVCEEIFQQDSNSTSTCENTTGYLIQRTLWIKCRLFNIPYDIIHDALVYIQERRDKLISGHRWSNKTRSTDSANQLSGYLFAQRD